MPTPPGFADCSIEMVLATSSRPAYITFGVDPTETEPSTVATSVWASALFAGSLVSMMDSSVTFVGVHVALGTDGAEDLAYEHPVTTVGSAALTSLPANCSLLVHKVTARGGRRGRGRMFIPWVIGEGDCDEGGLITASPLAAMQTKLDTFRIQLATNGVPMVLLHKPSLPGTIHPTTAGAPNPVLALRADKLIGTQRRRLGR